MDSNGTKLDAEKRRTVDGSKLTAEIGIDNEEIEWRKSFTRLDGDDTERLSAMEPMFDTIAETSQGIREVAQATDDRAASTEQVASMVDELVEQSEHVATEVETIAAANQQQTAQIEQIYEAIQRLSGGGSD